MIVNTDILIPMSEANQNFSKVSRVVDEKGMAVILKNNKPKYILVDFTEYNSIKTAMLEREAMIANLADMIIEENLEAFEELAK